MMDYFRRHCIPIQNLQFSDKDSSYYSLLNFGNNEPIERNVSSHPDITLHENSLIHQYSFESLVNFDANIKLINPVSVDKPKSSAKTEILPR